jgi:hypothetical protein
MSDRSGIRRPSSVSLAAWAVAALLTSCSTRDGFTEPPPPMLAPPSCVSACSTDGRNVVDCVGAVLESCAAEASCFEASCLSGCEAAKRAQSTVGCEYYAAKPSAQIKTFDNYDGSCYAVLVANTWNSPVTLDVEYDGAHISSSYFRIPRGSGTDIRYELLPEGKLPKDQLAVLFLAVQPPGVEAGSTYAPCPAGVGAAIVGQTEVRGSGFGKTFHVRSSAPVVAYDIYPYGGASSFVPSSSLLFPTSAWGTDNLAMTGYSADANATQVGALPYFQILAQENDTHVKLMPTVDLSSAGGAAPVSKGTLTEVVLQRGEFLQYTQAGEANGTPVAADKPIAVVAGSTCITIPNGVGACDAIHQQLPPIRLMGDTYVATRYRDRLSTEPETTPWRILAAADGTILTFDPPVAKAPATLERGMWVELWAPGPFVVHSQDAKHPIYVAAYMTGADNISITDGDPEMVNAVPVGQWLPSYVFLTDPTYGNTNLVFVRGPDVDGKYQDVQLDCAGTVSGWTRVGNTTYEVAYVDLLRKGLPQGGCDNGVHRAFGKGPFGLTVWGWDRYASYGYPAGMGTKTLNDQSAFPPVR